MQENHLAANTKVVQLNNDVLDFALYVTNEIGEDYRIASGYPVVNGALYTIANNAICLNKVIKVICIEGWSFAAPSILRTMYDLLSNLLVIVRAEDSKIELMALRYTLIFAKLDLNDVDFAEEAKEKIKEGISEISPAYQEEARNFFFQEKKRGYWFSPEYKDAKDVLERCKVDTEGWLYNKLSGGAHGGFLGLSLFRDLPDFHNTSPRADKTSQNLVLVLTTGVMMEIFSNYGCFMDSSIEEKYLELHKKFKALKDIIV